MEIMWLLTIFIKDPCCDISVTRFETEAECIAAHEVVQRDFSGEASIKSLWTGCAIATVKP